jgi:uncharacterized protein (DUF1778 family)
VIPRKRGPGRPRLPKGAAKGAVLSVRLTAAERAAVDRAARAAGRSPSDWSRDALVKAADAHASEEVAAGQT